MEYIIFGQPLSFSLFFSAGHRTLDTPNVFFNVHLLRLLSCLDSKLFWNKWSHRHLIGLWLGDRLVARSLHTQNIAGIFPRPRWHSDQIAIFIYSEIQAQKWTSLISIKFLLFNGDHIHQKPVVYESIPCICMQIYNYQLSNSNTSPQRPATGP
jgi:hypothetical protein